MIVLSITENITIISLSFYWSLEKALFLMGDILTSGDFVKAQTALPPNMLKDYR